jgi:hypothetical protein
MGIRLIFLSLLDVTNVVSCEGLSDCPCREDVPGNNASVRPYPKPTQVDW